MCKNVHTQIYDAQKLYINHFSILSSSQPTKIYFQRKLPRMTRANYATLPKGQSPQKLGLGRKKNDDAIVVTETEKQSTDLQQDNKDDENSNNNEENKSKNESSKDDENNDDNENGRWNGRHNNNPNGGRGRGAYNNSNNSRGKGKTPNLYIPSPLFNALAPEHCEAILQVRDHNRRKNNDLI